MEYSLEGSSFICTNAECVAKRGFLRLCEEPQELVGRMADEITFGLPEMHNRVRTSYHIVTAQHPWRMQIHVFVCLLSQMF